jgi:transcription initiation factor TFIIB
MTSPQVDIESLFSVFDTPAPIIETYVSRACSNCGAEDTVLDSVCTSCGLCASHFINDECEWTSGLSSDGVVHDPSRIGMPCDPLYSDHWGRGTLIKQSFKHGNKYALMCRLNFHDSMNHRDRALHKAYLQFDQICKQNLNLSPNINKIAQGFYKKIAESQLTRGAVRSGMKANCVFFACKEAKAPRTTQEIASAFGISTKDISRTYDTVRGYLQLNTTKTITRPRDMVPRIFSSLGFHMDREAQKMKMKCMKACELVAAYPKLMGKTPLAVASVTIVRVLRDTDLAITKQEVAEAAGISVATINKIDLIVKVILP